VASGVNQLCVTRDPRHADRRQGLSTSSVEHRAGNSVDSNLSHGRTATPDDDRCLEARDGRLFLPSR